jgi:predicted dithiol-disulfide oxidoreductase (DUF899 family)
MSLPDVVTRDEWLAARKELLADEKELTKAHDRLATKRRMLPMVRIDKEYVFEGPDGPVTLLELFDGRRQLIVRHFMFGPDWEKGCPGCTAAADEMSEGLLRHLNVRETSWVVVARAPFEKLNAYRAEHAWSFPMYSSFGSDFNYDFNVTLDESVAPLEYNYRTKAEHEAAGTSGYVSGDQPIEQPGESYFLREGDEVFHTYSTFARGTEAVGGSYYFLDLTALGRQEDWEEPKDRVERPHDASPEFAS